MANKIPWYDITDWKSIFITGIFAIGLAVIIFISYWSEIKQSAIIASYNGETIGTIVYLKENIEQNQSRYGNSVSIDSYTVHYSYDVLGFNYNGSNKIKGSVNNGRLLNIIRTEKSNKVKVKFDFDNPRKSAIILE